MLVAETRHSFAWQAAAFAVAATWVAPAPAAPGAHDAIAVAADFLLAGLVAMILATICPTCGVTAVLCQLV